MAWGYDQEGWEAEDYRRYLGHTMYIAQKARSRIYIDKAMVSYDDAIRKQVDKYGLEEFSKGNHDCTMDHFTVENTRRAQEERKAASEASRGGGGSKHRSSHYGTGKPACNAYNFGKEGCPYGNKCREAHKCSKCGRPSHKESECWGNGGKKQKE